MSSRQWSVAAAINAERGMNLHYAAVVEPGLVEMAFGPDSAKVWQTPPEAEKPTPPKKTP